MFSISDDQKISLGADIFVPHGTPVVQIRNGEVAAEKKDSDRISVSILQCDNVNTRLENAERLHFFQKSSGILWNTEII